MKNNLKKKTSFASYLHEQLKNSDVRKHYDLAGKQLEIAYQIVQLRKQLGMSQLTMAKKLGTTQSNVARIESGQQNFTTSTLQKIARIFQRELRIDFVQESR